MPWASKRRWNRWPPSSLGSEDDGYEMCIRDSYEAFGWPIPTYIHCSPVMRDAQHKMSKRHGDPSYADLKAQGLSLIHI